MPRTVESETVGFRECWRIAVDQLAQLHSIRLFFLDFSVPVVQRIEQGFPKGKMPFLHQFAYVVSSVQTTLIKPVE